MIIAHCKEILLYIVVDRVMMRECQHHELVVVAHILFECLSHVDFATYKS